VAHVHAVALSEAVKNAVDPALGWDVVVATSPDSGAMKHATLAVLKRIAALD
jgi:hypothetical protein